MLFKRLILANKRRFSGLSYSSQHKLYRNRVNRNLYSSKRTIVTRIISSTFRVFRLPAYAAAVLSGGAYYVDKSKFASDRSADLLLLREQIAKIKSEYTKDLDSLKKENKELRREILLKSKKLSSPGRIHDQLPRVVVIGDQSAGKTSVLEMVAQARLFPRGSGEMMTRSPVKVTLSEGPYHIASFKDDPHEYDLTSEKDLSLLRNEIEGQTISNEVISLSVKGPGLQRIVLVDLPGIISTTTQGMDPNTRNNIRKLATNYMNNPNAIILCIQDGSIDAERSNVTDLVSSIDPLGKRTIFVLTKVDLAESNQLNPNRIRKILDGQLFPMKALGYYAVVTGKGSQNDSIETIKEYEEEFFANSKLLKEGVLRHSQMTTENLSKAVSERFWKCVKDSVEQQADAYRAMRYNLEAEWKNTFPSVREIDREGLFEKGRNVVLDDLIPLNAITSIQWETELMRRLWARLEDFFMEKIFNVVEQIEDFGAYQTKVDILLKEWTEKELPEAAIATGCESLYYQLNKVASSVKLSAQHDKIFDKMRDEVYKETRRRHRWDEKATGRLRVIQNAAIEDRIVHSKVQWDESLKFMEESLKKRISTIDAKVKNLKGPNWYTRWTKWKSRTYDQQMSMAVIDELDNVITFSPKLDEKISADTLATVRRNLQMRQIDAPDDLITELYKPLIRRAYLSQTLDTCVDCRRSFYHYQQGFMASSPHDEVKARNHAKASVELNDCRELLLFARLLKMLSATVNSLRQQIMNDECTRVEFLVKQVLHEYSHNPLKQRELISGKRVQLAEDLKRTRHVQMKLEEFIAALNRGDRV